MNFDPRITPARPDLAAAQLKGKVEAERFVEGTPHRIARGRASLKATPENGAPHQTELLFGEIFTVYESRDGWAWGQAASDLYVGYLHTIALGSETPAPDHRVSALMTPLLPAPDVKHCPLDMLPLNAQVAIFGHDERYAKMADGYVPLCHLAPLGQVADDWVEVAARFTGTPYVWGGKSRAGMDCSGLVQTALQACGIASPRDTDMMERALGAPAPPGAVRARGDLIFWKGHVGIMLDGARLLHANAFHMEVTVEPLDAAAARIAESTGAITSVRRL